MTKNSEHWQRIRLFFMVLTALSAVLTFVFTKNLMYCTVVIGAAFLSALGLKIMMIQVDKFLFKGQGSQLPFFFIHLSKLTILALAFFGATQISQGAALFFILGISVMVLAILSEGIYLMVRGLRHD